MNERQREKSVFFVKQWNYLAVIAILLSGCATQDIVDETKATVFYPPLPNPPRIQYLTSFSKTTDVHAEESGFLSFILGEKSERSDIAEKPYGIAIHDGKLYVADTRGPGYAVLDLVQQKYRFVQGDGGGKMKKPINIAIDADGSKYITDTERNQVLHFSADDRFVRAFGKEDQFKPSDVAIHNGKLYIADVKNHRIEVLDKNTGETLRYIGKTGSKEGHLFYPTNIKIGNDGSLYASDTGNYRIQKFSLDGRFLKSIGQVGTGLGNFARPKGIALDHQTNMYVVDAAFENVQVIDKDNELLLFFGGPGDQPESINLPTDVEIDYEHASFFQKYADPNFKLEYVILIASQFGLNKVSAFGFGKMDGMDYDEESKQQ